MYKAQINEQLPSSEEKIDFKFSNFQAFQVPKICDKLLVLIISVKTGKTIARSNKALVRNGKCQWTKTLSQSIWISHHDSSKELEEHLFKFVVSVGSARSGILGEATINIASFYTSSRSSSPVSLPLKKCNYGTILQVKIQCLTPRTKLRVEGSKCSRYNNTEAVDENHDDDKIPSTQDLGPTSLIEKSKIMETSYGSNQNNVEVEYSLKKGKLYPKSRINGIKHNINSNCRKTSNQSSYSFEKDVLVSKSNNSSFKSRITHDEQEQEYETSSPRIPTSSSVTNVGSLKNLLEASEDTIEELLEQAMENKRVPNSQTWSDLEKEYKTTLYVEEENVDILESKLPERKEIEKDQMMFNSSLDSQVSGNELLEQKAMKLEKVKCETELRLFEMEEENIKLLDRVSELESQLKRVKDEHEITRLDLENSRSEKSDLQIEVKNLQNVEKLLLNAQEECEFVKFEKKKLQESAENLIQECNNIQKSYEDMTNGNADLYDQYSCLVNELTSESERLQKEVKHLKEEISWIDEQKSKLTSEKSNLESSLNEVHLKTEMTENEIQSVREKSELKIQDLTTELAAIKQNNKKLMKDYEKKLKLLTVSEQERQQLIEEAANLKDEVLDYKQKVENLKNEKSNLEASLNSVSNSFEELKAEKLSFFNNMSEFEDCKIQRDALKEKILRLEGDLTAKNESRLYDADIKNKIKMIKSTNLRYQLKIQQLEGEKNEYLKKNEDLQLLLARFKTGVNETRSKEDTNYAANIKMLKAELDEALDKNNKYRIQLQKLKSEGQNSLSKVEGETVTKEQFERTKSSLETELKDLHDCYLKMSLKYAEVEAERGDLVMQLKTNNGAKKMFQFLEKS